MFRPARACSLWLLLLALASGAPAGAWPVDVRQSLAVGAQREIPLATLAWAETDQPERLTVAATQHAREVLQVESPFEAKRSKPPAAGATLELIGRAEGEATLLLYTEGRFAVWAVSVGGSSTPLPPAPELVTAAQAACPGLKLGEAKAPGHRTLQVQVDAPACADALEPLLRAPAFLARDVSVVFSGEALQRQLAGLQAAFAEAKLPIEARYVGAGLVLSGSLTPAQHRRALWLTFEHTLGRAALTDHIEVRGSEDPDAPFATPGSVPVVPRQPASPSGKPPPKPRP